jgi:hypothetical protein
MRTRGATAPEKNQTAAANALIALVRLLARETARECLGQTATPPEIANSVDGTVASDPTIIPRQHDRSPARGLGEDGAASDRRPIARAGPNGVK